MKEPILFFDGVCNLCNGFIDFIIKHDSKKKFKVASLQGSTAKTLLPVKLVFDLNTVVLFKDGKLYEKSTAVLMVLKELSFPYSAAVIFYIIPTGLRDFLYSKLALNRYHLFGKKETCRIPTESERSRFLD